MKFWDKKGIAGMTILIIGVIAFIFILGFGTTWKITTLLSSIPKWGWYLMAFIIILMLLPKKK